MMKEIIHKNSTKNGLFKLIVDEKEVGLMTYTWAGEKRFIIDHTVVLPEHGGKGYGNELVGAGVKYARQEDVKIIPLCPFAKAVIEKTPEFQDVL